jgi:hypothetical protein
VRESKRPNTAKQRQLNQMKREVPSWTVVEVGALAEAVEVAGWPTRAVEEEPSVDCDVDGEAMVI